LPIACRCGAPGCRASVKSKPSSSLSNLAPQHDHWCGHAGNRGEQRRLWLFSDLLSLPEDFHFPRLNGLRSKSAPCLELTQSGCQFTWPDHAYQPIRHFQCTACVEVSR
jgi:hypothetical protein